MGHDLAQLEAQSKEIDEQISLLASGFGRRMRLFADPDGLQ